MQRYNSVGEERFPLRTINFQGLIDEIHEDPFGDLVENLPGLRPIEEQTEEENQAPVSQREFIEIKADEDNQVCAICTTTPIHDKKAGKIRTDDPQFNSICCNNPEEQHVICSACLKQLPTYICPFERTFHLITHVCKSPNDIGFLDSMTSTMARNKLHYDDASSARILSSAYLTDIQLQMSNVIRQGEGASFIDEAFNEAFTRFVDLMEVLAPKIIDTYGSSYIYRLKFIVQKLYSANVRTFFNAVNELYFQAKQFRLNNPHGDINTFNYVETDQVTGQKTNYIKRSTNIVEKALFVDYRAAMNTLLENYQIREPYSNMFQQLNLFMYQKKFIEEYISNSEKSSRTGQVTPEYKAYVEKVQKELITPINEQIIDLYKHIKDKIDAERPNHEVEGLPTIRIEMDPAIEHRLREDKLL